MKTNFYVTKEDFATTIEHCCFGPVVRRVALKKACLETLKYGFSVLYVNSGDAPFCKDIFEGKAHVGVPIGFPTGIYTTETKIKDGLDAIDNGADDLDVVMNVSRFLDGEENFVRDELCKWNEVMKANKKDVVTKIIIECPYLTAPQIDRAAKIVADAGADYVKQTTGQCPLPTWLLSHVHVMKKAIGDRIKIKASGHIIRVEDAIACLQYGAVRIGNDHGPEWMENFDTNYWNEK